MTTDQLLILSTLHLVLAFLNIPITIYEWVLTWYLGLVIEGTGLLLVLDREDHGQVVMRVLGLLNKLYGLYIWSFKGGKQRKKTLEDQQNKGKDLVLASVCGSWALGSALSCVGLRTGSWPTGCFAWALGLPWLQLWHYGHFFGRTMAYGTQKGGDLSILGRL